jgi:hypothetical protein
MHGAGFTGAVSRVVTHRPVRRLIGGLTPVAA